MHDHRLLRVHAILRLTYGLVPIVAGLDKFTNLLADWPSYLSPAALAVLPVSAQHFMYAVGGIEIAAGALVLSRHLGVAAYVVAAWLVGIALNLVLGGHYDIAVRDVGLAIGAFSLGQLHAALAAVLPESERTSLLPWRGSVPGHEPAHPSA